jgi:hypothetical protein
VVTQAGGTYTDAATGTKFDPVTGRTLTPLCATSCPLPSSPFSTSPADGYVGVTGGDYRDVHGNLLPSYPTQIAFDNTLPTTLPMKERILFKFSAGIY